MIHRYRLSGWRIASELCLPYLPPDPEGESADPDIEIRTGAFLPNEDEHGALVQRGPFTVRGAHRVDFAFDDHLAVRIEHGRIVTVAGASAVSPGELHSVLSGPVFAILAHQRGCPPLHAGAVALAGDPDLGAIAIAGHSGAGKSTLVAALMSRGHTLLSDDQLILDPATMAICPGNRSTKLWAASARALGLRDQAGDRVKRGVAKFHHDAGSRYADGPRRLRAIMVLAPSTGDVPVARRLAPGEAVAALTRLAHYGEIATAMGLAGAMLHHAAQIAQSVPVYRVERPTALDRIEALAETVLALPLDPMAA